MKAPQVIYLCLSTAFWFVASGLVIAATPGFAERAQNNHAVGIFLVTVLVGVNLGLLKWGGFFRSRD